jgi:outer membrane protein insertion porin family
VTTVTPIERNRVNLTFTVVEGEPARIKEVRIVGNKAFSESTLQGVVRPGHRRLAELVHQVDRYSRAKLNADLETLRSYYLPARLP